MKEFKYDVIQLIEGVRDRPCLWDKSIENYKDRVERRSAWEEIFAILDERYEEMTPEERRIMGEKVLYKWTNIRDTFVKTLKNKMGKQKRRYLLYDHLKFLIKVMPEDECVEYSTDDISVSYMKQEHESDRESTNQSHSSRKKPKNYDEPGNSSGDFETVSYTHNKKSKRSKTDEASSRFSVKCNRKKAKRSNYNDDSPNTGDDNSIDFVEVDVGNDPRVMNEDEAFFASLLPSVVRYNEDERLEFRVEVLSVMKKIKDKRKWVGD